MDRLNHLGNTLLSRWCNQIASFAVCVRALYFASVVERHTMSWRSSNGEDVGGNRVLIRVWHSVRIAISCKDWRAISAEYKSIVLRTMEICKHMFECSPVRRTRVLREFCQCGYCIGNIWSFSNRGVDECAESFSVWLVLHLFLLAFCSNTLFFGMWDIRVYRCGNCADFIKLVSCENTINVRFSQSQVMCMPRR